MTSNEPAASRSDGALRRRREASQRLPSLPSGHGDPLDGLVGQEAEPIGERALAAYAAAAEALNRNGLAAAVPDDLVALLRSAGLTVWPVSGEEAA